MSLLIKDDELLKKHDKTWGKVSNSIRKEFDGEPVYNQKYLKTKIKSYEDKINTYFHDNGIPKVIQIDSVFKWVKTIIHRCWV